MVSLLATAFAFTACSDNDEPEPLPEPSQEASVTLEVGTITDESIEFTLTPVNAVKAAWVYFEAANEREVTAEQVLGAMSADAEGAQTLVAEPLSPGTEYVIYAAVEGKNGEKVLSEPLKATTTGELIETEEFWGETASADFYAANNWGLTLTDAEGNEATFDLYIESAGKDYLPSNEFTVAEGTAPGTLGKGSYSYLTIGGEKLSIEEGELFVEADLEDVTEEGVFYHVEGQLTAGGRIFTILFDGYVAGTRDPNAPVEIVCSHAVLMDINDPQPGEFYVKLNTESWNYEIVFDFLAGADAAYLPSNTYSMEWGTLTPKTGLTGYYGAPTADALTECEIDVMFEDNVYTIEANAVGDNGTKFHIVYEGQIENMPEVVMIESVYPQVSWYEKSGSLVLADVPATDMETMYATFGFCAALYLESGTSMEYLNGFFSGIPSEDETYIDSYNSQFMYRTVAGGEPEVAMIVPDKSFVSVMSVMPDQDLNQIDFQLVTMSMDGVQKVWVGSYMGPLYGGGGVSTDPVDYPLYDVNEAKVVKHEGNLYQISFTNLNGPLTINFYADTFGAGAYHFDANGGSEKTFNGSFTRLGVELDEEDTVFEFESGSIGVVKQGDAYMFQFDNVIARAADGSAVNLGPVNGNAYETQFTVTIEGL